MTFFLVGPYYPFRGGIAQYLAVLGQKLKAKGHRVKVLSFRKQFPRLLFPGQTQIETSQDYIKLDSQALFIAWNPLSWWRTFLAARRGRPDALIFKYWMPFFAPGYAAVCVLAKRFTDIRTVYILDNVIPHEKRPGDRFFTRLALRWVDAYIVQSEVVKRDLLKWFPEARNRSIVLVPHPVYDCYADTNLSQEEARSRLGLKSQCRLLLFFGLVRHYKGLDVLLDAMPKVIGALGQDVHLLVAGEFYEPEENYRRQIERLGIGDYVTIVNQYVPNEEVGDYFRAADLLVLPYRSATQSGVIQVAYHFGLPVVSTRVGGIPEVIQEGATGFLVESEDPEQLAQAINRYFRLENRETLEGGLKQARGKYSWEALVGAIEDLIA